MTHRVIPALLLAIPAVAQTLHRPTTSAAIGPPGEGIGITMNLQWNPLETTLTGTPMTAPTIHRTIHAF